MNFSNPKTLALFFAFAALYWLLPRRWQLYWVAIFPVGYLLLVGQYAAVAAVTLLTSACYGLSESARQHSGRTTQARSMAGIALLCGAFLAYKLAQNLKADDGQFFVLLGASFYLLRMIHYLAESYSRNLKQHSFIEFAAYIVFPPTLLVGPINRFPEFLRDERRKRWDSKLFYSGLERILFGYFKVVVLANYLLDTKLSVYIEQVGGNDTAYGAWLGCLEYGLDLYFRFGGYCDIAIGLSALLGFRILENFNYPFIRSDISAFWKSWHISLSSWCRDYVFTPVAFLLKRPALGVIASMLILGIWHELSWRYIVWGLYHGLGIVGFQQWSRLKQRFPAWLHLPGALSRALGILITFNFVILSFAITRTDELSEAVAIYRTIFGEF
ncbi:MAG: MBOAT family protein [Halioglobus sp.]|nr:MBOAT family protein [Halioglobus sp.]